MQQLRDLLTERFMIARRTPRFES